MAVARAVGREVARTMVRPVAVEVARVVALARRRIWCHVCCLGCPRGGGAGENRHKSRPPLRRIVAEVIIVIVADGGHDQ